MEEFGGVVVAFLLAAGPFAVTVTKLVDTVRNLVANIKVPKVVWNILALVLGVVAAFAFEINLFDPVVAAIPALEDWNPDSALGQLLTGLAIGAMAGFWHEKMDQWSSEAKAAQAEGGEG